MLAIGILSLSVVVIFRDAIVSDDVFAFRDAAHFYYPLFQWTTEQWKAGEIPLWNPLEDLGSPVVADATSSVFYPGKILFLLPGEFDTWYKTYIIFHVWLCGIASFFLARHWKRSAPAASLTAISYALSGNVLFQYCNVVYLIGAAWLPLALRSGDLLLSQSSVRTTPRHTVLLAISLSMMVLGGDAQMAYHAGLMLAGLAWLKRKAPHAGVGGSRRALRLLIAASIAFGLAAVQSLPSSHQLQESTRASYDTPRNIYEFLRECAGPEKRASANLGFGQTLLGKTAPGHHSNIFDFSVGPWRFIELLWPNIGGRMFPQNERWMNAIPAEGRVWTPTLYMGCLPILLASLSFRLHRGSVRRRWLSWCFLLAVLAALGRFGVGWFFKEISFGIDGRDLAIGDPFGGLYWFLTMTLPGYVYFRYPGKLWVIATLAISHLAGQSLLNWNELQQRLLKRLAILLGVTCGLLLFIALLPINSLRVFDAPRISIPFGPLDVTAIKPQVVGAALHTICLIVLTAGLLKRGTTLSLPIRAWLLVFITAAELTLAHHWLLAMAPRTAMYSPNRSKADQLSTTPLDSSNAPPMRVFRRLPRGFPDNSTSSPDRFREILNWNSHTVFPKTHLIHGIGLVGSRHSLESAYRNQFLTAIGGVRKPTSVGMGHLRYLGVHKTVEMAKQGVSRSSSVEWNSVSATKRAWIVRDIDWRVSPKPTNASALARYMNAAAAHDGDGLAHKAIVDATRPPQIPASLLGNQEKPIHDDIRIVTYENKAATLKTQLTKPGLVVMNDAYTDGWKAYIPASRGGIPTQLPIMRTNGIMRGVYLPAGQFTLEMRYEPREFFLGARVSSVTWILCLLYLIIHFGLEIVRCIGSHS